MGRAPLSEHRIPGYHGDTVPALPERQRVEHTLRGPEGLLSRCRPGRYNPVQVSGSRCRRYIGEDRGASRRHRRGDPRGPEEHRPVPELSEPFQSVDPDRFRSGRRGTGKDQGIRYGWKAGQDPARQSQASGKSSCGLEWNRLRWRQGRLGDLPLRA